MSARFACAPLEDAHSEAAAALLVHAFHDDPTLAWCFGRGETGYADRLAGYFRAGDPWHRKSGYPAMGAFVGMQLVGAAYTMHPGLEPDPDGLEALFARLEQDCGSAAVARFRDYNERTDAVMPDGDYHMLAILGVDPAHQRSGAGRALVEWTCELADADPESDGVVLDTGNPSNLAFYARFGFEEHARVDFDGFVEQVLVRPRRT